jgi:ABC-type multidrug transport system ATPase subunit
VFGDAMRRSVLLAATLPTLKGGGLLLIDEVETGIHVSALGRVFSWLITSARKLGVQVLVTTHSLEALDALAAAPATGSADEVVAFNLAQREDRTECKRFAGDLLPKPRRTSGAGRNWRMRNTPERQAEAKEEIGCPDPDDGAGAVRCYAIR